MKIVNFLPMFMLLGLVPPATAQQWETNGVKLPLGESRPGSFAFYGSVERLFQAQKTVQKVYPVADLVVPLHASDKSADDNAAHLIKLAQMANPETWEALGGCGKAAYYPNSHALVVSQTPDVQERVASMLESLRKTQDTQVTMEIRFVRASPAMWERMGADLPVRVVPQVIRQVDSDGVERVGIDFDKPNATPPKTVFWNDKQVHAFLEMVQGDRRSNIIMAPKLTTINGQSAMLEIGSKYPNTTVKVEECKGRKLCLPVIEQVFIGVRCETLVVAKENGKEVMLRFKAHIAEPLESSSSENAASVFPCVTPELRVQSIAVDRTATIPTGHTLVLPAGTFLREQRIEHASPVLCKVPYVNRLFRNVGYGMVADDVVVLVTPRILVQESCETKSGCGTATAVCGKGGLVGIACDASRTQATAPCCAVKPCPPAVCCQTKTIRMNLADVVALSTCGVSDEVIINQMTSTDTTFKLGTEDIIFLKSNKVSDRVVMHMQNTRPRVPAPVASSPYAPPMPLYPPMPVYTPSPNSPVQYLQPTVPTPPAFPPTMPYSQRLDSFSPPLPSPGSLRPAMPGPLSMPRIGTERLPIYIEPGFQLPSSGTAPLPPVSFQQAVPARPACPSGEIGQQIVEAAAWLVDGVATFVADGLPTALSDVGQTVRPAEKFAIELMIKNEYTADPDIRLKQLPRR